MRSISSLIILVVMLLAGPPGGALHAQFPFDECSNTEAWVPVADGFPGRAMGSAEMDGKLYVVYRQPETTPGDSSCVLARLDGGAWTTVSTFRLNGGGSVSDLEAYDGELYLSGSFDSLDLLPNTGGLAKWDGSEWREVPGVTAMNGRAQILRDVRELTLQMTVFKDELIISGAFKTIDGDTIHGILGWNGTAWRTLASVKEVGGLPPGNQDSLFITSYAEWRGDLYVSGYFRSIGGVHAERIAKWNGTGWLAVAPPNPQAIGKLVVYNDRLYAIRQLEYTFSAIVMRWDGSVWEGMPQLARVEGFIREFRSLTAGTYNGSLYILGQCHVRGSGPPFDTVMVAVRWDDTKAHYLARPDDGASFMTSHDGALYIGGRFTVSCGVRLNGIASLCDAPNCVGISGRVIVDPNGDCASDSGKRGVPENIIEILPGPHYAITDSTGRYLVGSGTGSFTVRSTPKLYHVPTCPTAGFHTAALPGNGDRSTGNNFGYAVLPDKHDIEISLIGDRMRPGRSSRYRITCVNRGTVDESGTDIALTFDERLRFDSASVGIVWNAARTMGWRLPMKAGERRTIDAWFTPATTVRNGMVICAHATCGDEIDETPEGNSDEFCIEVTTAYDPNDIAVHPAGYGASGIIGEHDTVLTYTVRFQNTGSDTAFRVVVIDTLSRYVDIASFELGASSHPFRLRFGEGGSLIWDFRDIDLPTERADTIRSQGYFKYSVHLKRGLLPSTEITNRASIYFDYNDPITTNTARSTLVPILGVPSDAAAERAQVSIYPNPTHGVLHLRGDLTPGSIVRVENLLGQVILTKTIDGDDTTLDLGHLPSGTYFIARSFWRTRVVKN